jgi:RNA polymerase sigma factor (sigma-70 family)
VEGEHTRDLAALVHDSADGDAEAWNELVQRYQGLVVVIIRHYRLSAADAQDVAQTVWLRLVENLRRIREPAALPGWITTVTRHECEHYLRVNSRSVSVDPLDLTRLSALNGDEAMEELLAAERHQVLRDALAELAERSPLEWTLLRFLTSDPPSPYEEIRSILGIAKGSIGPTRRRAIDKLRETRAVQTYLRGVSDPGRTGGARDALAKLE